MPLHYDHHQPVHHNGAHCPLCHEAPHTAQAVRDEDVLQRLDHVEHLLHAARWPAPQSWRVEEAPVSTAAPPTRPGTEVTLWQGRPAFLASAFGLLTGLGWLGGWGLALSQLQAVASSAVAWHRLVQEWLWQERAFTALWWYMLGASWLDNPGLAEDIIACGLLLGLLGTAGLLAYRLRRAVRTRYCLTTQRLSTRHRGQWADVDLAELHKVSVRRPCWGHLLGYGHIQWRGRFPMPRRVRWWGVPQRAILTALLQAILQQAPTPQRRSPGARN